MTVPIAALQWYRLQCYAWYRFSAIVSIVRHHCFASPFVNPADERHNGKCDNAKNDTWQQCRHTWKKPDSNSHHREYQKSEDINREHHFAIDPACSSCLFQFLPHPPEVVPEIEPLLILLPFHHAQCINPRWNISATFATIRAIAIRTILASFLPGCFIFP